MSCQSAPDATYLSVPISVAYQRCLSVPISNAYLC
ncbi:unnamed protein product, partial [Staurois parvus]